ncbi:MAG: hypothetical protein DRQ99_29825 [Candidatus Parabeggiatoa sp. nov. 3]|jgi:hypothetical protein|nr:MAG: hypothetical protein DRQ99_29825 [Gammaproteobacteria bacterium]
MDALYSRRRFSSRRRSVGVGLGEDQVTEDMVMDSKEQNDDSSSNKNVNKPSATTSYELEKK